MLQAYNKGNPKAPKMKGLDVVKVLMGIMSQRDAVKQFQWDGKFWASLNEYDYEQLLTLVEEQVALWNISHAENSSTLKQRKLNN